MVLRTGASLGREYHYKLCAISGLPAKRPSLNVWQLCDFSGGGGVRTPEPLPLPHKGQLHTYCIIIYGGGGGKWLNKSDETKERDSQR